MAHRIKITFREPVPVTQLGAIHDLNSLITAGTITSCDPISLNPTSLPAPEPSATHVSVVKAHRERRKKRDRT